MGVESGLGVLVWLVVPALVISGVALWQWHRLRARLRTRKG